jgi:hypothetical protein
MDLKEMWEWLELQRKQMWEDEERIRALVYRIEQQIIEADINENSKNPKS